MTTAWKLRFIVGLLVAAACGDDDGSSQTPGATTTSMTNITPPVAGTGGGATPPPPSTNAWLIVENRYRSTLVTGVFLSSYESSSWGPNLLAGDIIFPGQYLKLTLLRCDDYFDLKVVDSSGDIIGQYWSIFFGCGDTQRLSIEP